jgi:two-component system response regulator QseB
LLIVEDDALIADGLVRAMRAAGHAVDHAPDGVTADDALRQYPYSLVILDLGLPKLDGIEVLKRLRQRDSSVPVLVLTARDALTDRIAGLDAGADDYLVKPITIDELAARLRAMVRRSAGRAQAVWQHGDLEYDPAAKIVRWKGQRVELTGFELALLETLLKHPQRVLSKAHLQEKLYDWSGTEPESNAIEVHIHHLRRKIDPSIVRTVRGVGYSLGGETAPS